MHSLSKWFEPGERRAVAAQERLAQSYKAVFTGSPTQEDQGAVMADLYSFGGLFTVALPDEDLTLREGKRQVAYRILRFIELDEAERTAATQAAVLETLVSDNEGQI